MMIRGYAISTRILAIIVGAVLLILAVSLFVRSCDNRRSRAAQARVERSQAEAASNSARDAIGTVARSGEAERASEDLGRTNERDIRAAEGADTKIGAGVNAAGRAALCRRRAYANEAKCKVKP